MNERQGAYLGPLFHFGPKEVQRFQSIFFLNHDPEKEEGIPRWMAVIKSQPGK